MKLHRIQWDILTSEITNLKKESNLPLLFDTRVKLNQLLKTITSGLEPHNSSTSEAQEEIIKKYDLRVLDNRILLDTKEDDPKEKIEKYEEARKALHDLSIQSMNHSIDIDILDSYKLTKEDFKDENGKSLGIETDINNIIEYLFI